MNIIDYKFINNNNKIDCIISPYYEILRFNIISGLNTCFEIKFKELNKDIYNINELLKNNNSKLNDLINKWCWHQYMSNKCLDYVIPYIEDETYDYTSLLKDLNYILNVKNSVNELYEDHIIIQNLKNTISNYLYIEYRNFINSIKQIDNNTKNSFIIKIYDNKSIKLSYIYNNKDYNVCIYSKVYNRIKKKLIINSIKYKLIENYNDNIDLLLDNYIFCLIFRYSYIDSGNQQLAINYNIKKIFKNFGINYELFGSCINSISYFYCSLFYDIEQYFGSHGDFFELIIKQGIYWCNPPYDELILNKTATKLLNILENNNKVVFLVTLPIWDKYTQNKLNNDSNELIKRNYNIDTDKNLHNDFYIYYLLKDYIQDELTIPKHRISYFNYRKYCSINAVNTYMLIIYNNNIINKEIVQKIHDNFDYIIELDKINFYSKVY